jgi:hypothetical protein
MTDEIPRPAEGPDREALLAAMNALYERNGWVQPTFGQIADAVLALLPTPPAPGDGHSQHVAGTQPGACDECFAYLAGAADQAASMRRDGWIEPAPGGGGTDLRGEVGARAAVLSRWVDDGLAGRDPETIVWHRVAKIGEEAGEVIDALIGATGGNPRKGVVGSMDHVVKELLDVAATALGAVEHLTGNQGTSGDRLAVHFGTLLDRVDLPDPAALAARDTDQGARDALAEVRALSKAAAPGPWTFHGVASVAGGMIYDPTRTIAGVYYEQPEDHDGSIVRHLLVSEADANGALIVAAVNYVRAALARATPEAGPETEGDDDAET